MCPSVKDGKMSYGTVEYYETAKKGAGCLYEFPGADKTTYCKVGG